MFEPDRAVFLMPCPAECVAEDGDLAAEKIAFATRYLTINDATRADRDGYAAALFTNLTVRVFTDDETHALSRARDDYDLMLVGGSDTVRLGRYVKLNAPLLANTACIALGAGTTPTRRARLLSAGFDEVIDCARMPLEEARARVLAVISRYGNRVAAWATTRSRDAALAEFCAPGTLTPRERRVLLVLASHAEEVIASDVICKAIKPQCHFACQRGMKVTISGLRRKLKAGYMIVSDYRGGYALLRDATREVNVCFNA